MAALVLDNNKLTKVVYHIYCSDVYNPYVMLLHLTQLFFGRVHLCKNSVTALVTQGTPTPSDLTDILV